MGWPTTVFMQRLIPAIFAALSMLPSRSRNKVVRLSLAFQPSLRRESETQTRDTTDNRLPARKSYGPRDLLFKKAPRPRAPPTRHDPIGERHFRPLEIADRVSDISFYVAALLSFAALLIEKAEQDRHEVRVRHGGAEQSDGRGSAALILPPSISTRRIEKSDRTPGIMRSGLRNGIRGAAGVRRVEPLCGLGWP
jgi:hypothetical protein